MNNPGTAGKRGLRLLFVLMYRDVIKELLSMLSHSQDFVVPLVLSILTFIGKHKPINGCSPELQDILS